MAGDETVTVAPADFFTPGSGITLASGAVEVIAGKSIVWNLRLTGTMPLSAGSQNVALGAVNTPYRPRSYFAPFTGWPAGGGMSGLVGQTDGALTVRWSSIATTGSQSYVLGGSWPI